MTSVNIGLCCYYVISAGLSLVYRCLMTPELRTAPTDYTDYWTAFRISHAHRFPESFIGYFFCLVPFGLSMSGVFWVS